jgi:hypothetical protein
MDIFLRASASEKFMHEDYETIFELLLMFFPSHEIGIETG